VCSRHTSVTYSDCSITSLTQYLYPRARDGLQRRYTSVVQKNCSPKLPDSVSQDGNKRLVKLDDNLTDHVMM